MRCWSRILVAALVSLAVFGVPSNRASAADLADAWINVFSVPDFNISSVVNGTNTTSTGRHQSQIIDGTHNGQRLRFYIQRSQIGFTDVLLSEKSVARLFEVERSDVSDYRKVKIRGGRGASVVHQGCRLILVGMFGTARIHDAYEYAIFASTCGDGDQLAAFLTKIRLASRERNAADIALRNYFCYHPNEDAWYEASANQGCIHGDLEVTKEQFELKTLEVARD